MKKEVYVERGYNIMIINKVKTVQVNKILYSKNDRSDIIPANTTLYNYVQNFIC